MDTTIPVPIPRYDRERDVWVIRDPDPPHNRHDRWDPFCPEVDAPELRRDIWAMEFYLPNNTPVGGGETWGDLELDERMWTLAAWAYHEWWEVEPEEDPDEGVQNTIHPPIFDLPPLVEIAAGVCLHCGQPIVWRGGGERWGHALGGPAWWYCPICGAVWTSDIYYTACPFCGHTEIEVHHVAQPVDPEPYHLWVRAEQRKEEKREEQPTE